MKLAHSIAHFLIPRHTNNHRAKLLHNSSLIIIAALFVAFQIVMNAVSAPEGSILGYAANISIDEVIKLTNQKRADAGLPPLKHNPQLSVGAKSKGEHMLSQDYWAHVAPDGTQPWKFFGDVGYKYRYAGENLARDFSNAASAVNAWMASPSHRDNLLSSKYQEIGIGVVEGDLSGNDTTLIVQFFGTSLTDTIPVQPIAAAQTSQASAAPVVSPRALATPRAVAVTTSQPTVRPTPAPTFASTEVLIADTSVPASSSNRVLISPFNTTRGISAVLIMLLMIAFIVDIVVVSRRRITRVSGRSVAHVAFLGMLLAIVMIVEAGQIL